jgi:hypothetical protein
VPSRIHAARVIRIELDSWRFHIAQYNGSLSNSQPANRQRISKSYRQRIYTYHLIEALQGANNRPGETTVKLSNLMNHLGRSVPESARDSWNAEQVPFFETAAEDFPVAPLRGGKGLPAGGWPAVEEKSRATIGQIVQAIGERSVANVGNISGGVIITGEGNQVIYGSARDILDIERPGRAP